MLKVLHVLSSLGLGGAERITVELAATQRAEGVDARILSLRGTDDFLVDSVRGKDIPLIVCGNESSRLSRYRYLLKLFNSVDVIHIHSRGAFKFVAPILPFARSARIIYTRHGLFPDDSPVLRLVYAAMRPFVDHVTFVTESGGDVFRSHHHWKPEKMVVVRNGVAVPELKQRSIGFPVRFGSVGRMVPIKGQLRLLDALEKLLKLPNAMEDGIPRFALKFYGNGPLEGELRRRADDIGKGVVEFCGEEPDLEKIYSGIDVLVVASESEGLSMVIMEAMARSIPVVATDVGGNPTLVHHGVTGLLVKEQTAEAICAALAFLLGDISLIESQGKSARQLIENEFSLLKTHKAYMACYEGRV